MTLPNWLPIERVIAFIVAPIATPLSGALAIWLAKHFPGAPHVSGGAIYAFAATTAAGVAGAFIKWLDGRQKFTAQLAAIEHDKVVTSIESAVVPADRKTLLNAIEAIVKAEIASLAGSISRGVATSTTLGLAKRPSNTELDVMAQLRADGNLRCRLHGESLSPAGWPSPTGPVAD